MSNQRYPEEFKIEAVKQVTERGLPVADVAARLGMSAHSLYAWSATASLRPSVSMWTTSKQSCVAYALNSSVSLKSETS